MYGGFVLFCIFCLQLHSPAFGSTKTHFSRVPVPHPASSKYFYPNLSLVPFLLHSELLRDLLRGAPTLWRQRSILFQAVVAYFILKKRSSYLSWCMMTVLGGI